jgi:hypothetical protein
LIDAEKQRPRQQGAGLTGNFQKEVSSNILGPDCSTLCLQQAVAERIEANAVTDEHVKRASYSNTMIAVCCSSLTSLNFKNLS